ncbi:MAG TPA: YfiR family protein [Candidatus Dormibacteraeota bacterium]|nr:YfiR family protein [Candidatus Dormibacteraeota bacterium]
MVTKGRRKIWKFTIAAACLICLLAAQSIPAQGADSASSEYLIKAGFIYNFAKLMEWPAPVFPEPNSPIVIAILGTDPFQGTLDNVLRGKQVNGREFVVKHLKWGDDLKGCNIIFVSSSEKAHFDDLFRMIHGLPILTIGDTPGFAERGGIINFVLEDDKVRFEIDVNAAKQARINISSRLLALAKIVPDTASDGRRAQ